MSSACKTQHARGFGVERYKRTANNEKHLSRTDICDIAELTVEDIKRLPSAIRFVDAWVSMMINLLLINIVLAIWLCKMSFAFCVIPVQYALYFFSLFQIIERKFAEYSRWKSRYPQVLPKVCRLGFVAPAFFATFTNRINPRYPANASLGDLPLKSFSRGRCTCCLITFSMRIEKKVRFW